MSLAQVLLNQILGFVEKSVCIGQDTDIRILLLIICVGICPKHHISLAPYINILYMYMLSKYSCFDQVWNYKLRRCLFTLLGHLDYIRTTFFHHVSY